MAEGVNDCAVADGYARAEEDVRLDHDIPPDDGIVGEPDGFRRDQGRALVVRTEHPESGTVCVRVQDTGPGLAPGADGRIFEPFYSTKPAGMGMGLAIARSIIEAHGGFVTIRPNPTRGVTALFTLPLGAHRG